MKILVTGGAGFIGSHVVDGYIAAGHEVLVVDNMKTGRRVNLNPAARFVEMDLLDEAALRALFAQERPEVVNHHAAQIDVRRSMTEPAYDARVNILGSLHLLDAARDHGTRKVIYISSGGACYGEPHYLPCDEAHPVNPLSPYGVSKHTVEHYLFLYRQAYGLGYTVLRYPNVYGPRQDPLGEAGVVAIFTHQMLHGGPVTIYGSGEQGRDFVHVADCARANLLALEGGDDAIFNLGSGEATTVNALFQVMQRLTEYPHEPQYAPARAGETFLITLDASRAREALGWRPHFSLAEGLHNTVSYYRAGGV